MTTTSPEPAGPSPVVGPADASALVAACEQAWRAIQDQHPELPHAVIVLGTGVERGRLVKLGHWWAGRWIADGEPRGEVLLAGEALHLPATDVFEVLLHEAAHGLNAARHIKDTSRGGRYHNRHFQHTAEAIGLTVTKLGPYGWAHTALTEPTIVAYARQIDAIAAAMRIARTLTRPPTTVTGPGTGTDGRQDPPGAGTRTGPATCGCGRRLRMAPSVLAQGPVLCGLCHEPFTTAPRTTSRTHPADPQPAAPSEPDPAGPEEVWRRQARQTIVAAFDDPIGRHQFAQVAAWYGLRQAGHDPTLRAPTRDEQPRLETLARAMLIADGTLQPPLVTIAGREFAVGDAIRIDDTTGDHRDGAPTAGMYGTVTHVDPAAGQVSIDVPIAGRYQVSTLAPLAAALRHAYTDPPATIEPGPTLPGDGLDLGCEL